LVSCFIYIALVSLHPISGQLFISQTVITIDLPRYRSSNPITGLYRPWGFQEVEAPRFQDKWHMKVVRLSALRISHLYPRKYSWFSFML